MLKRNLYNIVGLFPVIFLLKLSLRYFNVTLEQFPNSPQFLAQQLASEKASIVINYRLMEVQ